IPIKRGDSTIMTAISKNSPRPLMSEDKMFMINASLARFGEERKITPNDMRGLAHLDSELRVLKEADLITSKQLEAKRRFAATLEFMRMGAIKGVINDGEDNKLYEFKNDVADIEFKDQNPLDKLDVVSDNLTDEFGYSPEFMILASRDFFKNVLNYNGTLIMPYTLSFKNSAGDIKKFIEDNKAYAVPLNTADTFIEYYTYAQSIDAMRGLPTQYFSNVYELPKGEGYNVVCESVTLPICVRPYAINSLIWSS
ncbi:hypothetical protein AWC38_SpisGene25736, partial [Stylophora pistillata]